MKSTEKRNTAVGPQIRQKKTHTGRVGQAVWVFSVLALGLFSATQFAAYQFNYHPALGVNAHGLYPPWMILLWGARWHARYWDIFSKAGSIGVMVSAIGMIGLFMRRLLRANTSKANEYMHGSARWASEKDI